MSQPLPVIEVMPRDLSAYRQGNVGVDYVHRFESGVPGPHVLVNALTHGNEICGAIALDWLLQRTGQEQVTLVGHSAGGQMIGLLPNHHRVAKLVGVSASTGWFKGMKPSFRFKARLGLRCLVPLGAMVKGYAPTSAVGLGEDLPARVAQQWGQWCAAGGYATNAIRNKPEQDFHQQVRTPITVLHASDDDIATPKTVADLLRTFPTAPKQALQLKPADHGLKSIGHIDWFRSSHKSLWPIIAKALHPEAAAGRATS